MASELGEFLRTSRAALSPEDAGVEPGRGPGEAPRRVRGLRREEVARLAGVSVDYYTRLEQGRHSTPSETVVNALARALRLDDVTRAHLLDLAHPARRERGREAPPAQRVRPALRQMMASFTDHPALVLGRRTDVLASNTLATRLFTDWKALPPGTRNYTRWVLLDPAARERFVDWESVAADAVGTLRREAGRRPGDPSLNELVGELTIASPQFRAAWDGHRVHERTHGTKRMRHPEVGAITLRFETLVLPGDDDQTLFVYSTDPGSPSSDNLRLLGMLGTPATTTTPAASGPPTHPAAPASSASTTAPVTAAPSATTTSSNSSARRENTAPDR
ncbi:helix-turn-helix transcriptional regulator [Kineosporia succinea]|uniref:DNA-binding XRE family transcriptional regulator n=1 Tax=Kineosporia succinea TaxID=84632 RepID=A0ABT9NWY2_9ACTN|nr:helix-turn-helix transcriptional regulator [Kineosporia succinea]MDP9824934.1 DNA-binding XRE family transcriptional regulator [Kineosporia succinea]